MNALRLLADDLTGALDSAAAFAPAFGAQRVVWRSESREAAAISTGAREAGAQEAARRMGALAPFLAPAPGRVSFHKLDSLLRGHAGAELCAILDRVDFARVIVAPAIPFQGRATRAGRQWAREGESWRMVGEDVAATLAAAGRPVALCKPGDAPPPGVSLWDAGTDADLSAIVAAGRAAGGSILWVGAAGLAAALAAPRDASFACAAPAAPLLGLVGANHPVMLGQLAAIAPARVAIGEDAEASAAALAARLAAMGAAFAVADLPVDMARDDARATIARRFAALLARLDPPAALFVSGGETLADVVDALGVEALDVVGAFEPGVPVSRLVGSRRDGLTLFSKSGAFGAPDLLRRLVESLPPVEKTDRA